MKPATCNLDPHFFINIKKCNRAHCAILDFFVLYFLDGLWFVINRLYHHVAQIFACFLLSAEFFSKLTLNFFYKEYHQSVK